MLALLGEHKTCFLFKELFLQQLPKNVRTSLANSKVTDYRELAQLANVYQAASHKCTATDSITTSVFPVLRAAARGSDERPAPAARQSAEQGLCFFHARFGAKAKKCRPPCTFNVSRNMPTVSSIVANDTAYLLFITDSLSGRHFLCDTVSVLPASTVDRRSGEVGSPLEAANQGKIRTYGKRLVPLCFNGQRFSWEFVLADVSRPLLGADFLCTNGLLVDVKNCCLVTAEGFNVLPCSRSTFPTTTLSSALTDDCEFTRLLCQFPNLTKPTFSSAVASHGIVYHISTFGLPVHARARRLDPVKLAVAKAEFANMEKLGIVRRSKSPWASSLHIVPKADASYCPCGDYRRLNDITTPDRYPVPNIQDFSAQLAVKTIFSKVHLIRGYHQVPVFKEDIPKTAVITPFGLFEFLRMPFGLKNAAQTFQRMIDSILRDLDFLFVYLNDILVASASRREHLTHLQLLFARLGQHGLIINPAKWQFGLAAIDFLGHRITSSGAVPLPDKVDAITKFPVPHTTKALQEFLGMVNFYHRFILQAAELMHPLYRALKGHSRNTQIAWSEEMTKSFENAKLALAQATMLSDSKCPHCYHYWCPGLCSGCCTRTAGRWCLATPCIYQSAAPPKWAEVKHFWQRVAHALPGSKTL